MANPLKGEVAFPAVPDLPGFEAGGTLVLDFNALCTLEDELGEEIGRIGAESLQSPKMMRTVFRVAMEEHHKAVDDVTVGKIIQAVGIDTAAALVLRAFSLSFPEAAKDGDANPPKKPAKPAGTGKNTSRRGAK
ncbi:hypothetical protein [Sphingomonas sp. MMS24-J13]|uniref:hypothetical protein n=1 Tax=Sphingomonas sp. MMS24-J13 TaxID=3238686 RepID=UPI00384B0DA5